MGSVISSPADRAIRPHELNLRLAHSDERALVMVLTSESFARTAWRSGRRRARAMERETLRALIDLAGKVTPPSDVVVHAPGTEYFAIAFIASARAGMNLAHLTAIERRVAAEISVDSVTGWMWIDARDDVFDAMIVAAREAHVRRQRRELATLLHDVGTPLSSIHSSLTAVLEGIVDGPTERRFLTTARDECARAVRLIREFLVLESRDDAVSDLGSALSIAVAAVEPLARDRGTRLRVFLDTRPAVVAIDPDHAVAVLVALLENAVKHGRDEGLVHAYIRTAGVACELRIDDDGPGIPAGSDARIFEYGARAGRSPGSGIGLARARNLLERRGGNLHVERSTLGGASFTLRMPLWIEPAVAGADPPAPVRMEIRSPAGDRL